MALKDRCEAGLGPQSVSEASHRDPTESRVAWTQETISLDMLKVRIRGKGLLIRGLCISDRCSAVLISMAFWNKRAFGGSQSQDQVSVSACHPGS